MAFGVCKLLYERMMKICASWWYFLFFPSYDVIFEHFPVLYIKNLHIMLNGITSGTSGRGFKSLTFVFKNCSDFLKKAKVFSKSLKNRRYVFENFLIHPLPVLGKPKKLGIHRIKLNRVKYWNPRVSIKWKLPRYG